MAEPPREHRVEGVVDVGADVDGDGVAGHPVRHGVAGGVEVLAERANDVALGEDAVHGVALHHEGRTGVVLAHHGGRFRHRGLGAHRDEIPAHDLADRRHERPPVRSPAKANPVASGP